MGEDPRFRLHHGEGGQPPRVSASGDIDLHNVEAFHRLVGPHRVTRVVAQ